jgi:hypothetical protein
MPARALEMHAADTTVSADSLGTVLMSALHS